MQSLCRVRIADDASPAPPRGEAISVLPTEPTSSLASSAFLATSVASVVVLSVRSAGLSSPQPLSAITTNPAQDVKKSVLSIAMADLLLSWIDDARERDAKEASLSESPNCK